MIFDLLNNILVFFQEISGDWGLAIVMLTILVKLAVMPISIKQKINLKKQEGFREKQLEIEKKYKHNKARMEQELQAHYVEASKSMLGCLGTLIQLPIVMTLYRVVMALEISAPTILIPWVSSIGLVDSYFLVPILSGILMMAPGLINYYVTIKNQSGSFPVSSIVIMGLMGMFITIKAPIALGIYFITSSIVTIIEEVIFKVFYKNKICKVA